ncbi:hypothetical protein MesoLjLc_65000 [Mesorhizobium sp. L-8-10]|uniref:SGNH/GDSL hydrolase family protein n=1 Tax=unclassified Mesorhizobium TaxID=325217 RepID=UPI001925A267|nr:MULTISPECIES: SGNH/GDSL hydrolase family protein [unclassified Mesorhizobium]BCH26585.1 hypothetical protein MesoLjLb_63700 [Mesorhizobium sp. L-8-3]BCH34570.1 hypothetical protein MesoLjLc_65000 [Mesorhizobium sp. L-8-10]
MAAAKSSGKRITLDQLKKRAAKGTLTDKDLRSYFRLDEYRSKAFAPAIQLDYARVDTDGKELPDREVAEIFNQATSTRREKPAPSQEAPAAPVKILVEGDSWFNLPDIFMPRDAVDILRETFNVSSVAMWGDTLENMLKQKQYVQKLESGNFRHFLFSGGGNDVLGSIGKYVKTRTPGDTDPAHAPGYVKPSFTSKVKEIISGYQELADDVRQARGSRTVLYVHAYANAIPKPNGRYLGRRLEALGFDPATVGPLARAIVAHMVGRFNAALQSFAAARANIVYVDLRTKVTAAGDWHSDEIHPSTRGARKVATAFAGAIGANSPAV